MAPDAPSRRAQTPARFPAASRIRLRRDFLLAQGTGRRVHAPHFVVIVLGRADPMQRIGITVTKKIARGAVARNRIRRVVRETFRRHRDWFPIGADVVVLARAGAQKLVQAEVDQEFFAASPAMQKARGGARA